MAVGSDVITGNSGAGQVLNFSREYPAPESVDSVNQEANLFSQFKTADQTLDAHIVEFDLLRQKESRMQMGGAFPGALAHVLRMRNAALPRAEKSSILAGAQGNVGFPAVAEQLRRLFGPRGGAAHQDVFVAADIDLSSEEETDFDAWAAYRKAKSEKEA